MGKGGAQKRGGGQLPLSLDFAASESRQSFEPADDWTPERLFERQWVITLLDHVMSRLQAECAAAGKSEHFEQLKGLLAGRSAEISVAEAAAALGLSEEAARQAVRDCGGDIASYCGKKWPAPWRGRTKWMTSCGGCLRPWRDNGGS